MRRCTACGLHGTLTDHLRRDRIDTTCAVCPYRASSTDDGDFYDNIDSARAHVHRATTTVSHG